MRWIHSAASDNPLEEPLLRKVSRGQDVVEHPAYQPHPIINWPWIKTGLVSCYLQRVCRLGWALCLLPCREVNRYKGSGCSHFKFGKASYQVVSLCFFPLEQCLLLENPPFLLLYCSRTSKCYSSFNSMYWWVLFYKYLHLELERTFHLLGVSLQIRFHRLGNDLTNLVLCLFVLTAV